MSRQYHAVWLICSKQLRIAAPKNSQKLLEMATQTGQRPAEKVAQHSGEFSPQLVGQDTAEKGEKHLNDHGYGENQADLYIRNTLGVHIKSGRTAQ